MSTYVLYYFVSVVKGFSDYVLVIVLHFYWKIGKSMIFSILVYEINTHSIIGCKNSICNCKSVFGNEHSWHCVRSGF